MIATTKRQKQDAPVAAPVNRCAIYTRKSTEEGLEQEFNSLDAQRESAEAYIASQKAGGWVCLGNRYDDGGYTGGNMDRPAFQRLMADVEAGRIDCVVVYKVDRLSRSLLDFAKIMEVMERHHVSFVSVTQQFNTTTSMGRLMLNVLLSFAQFEREIISERTRDKIAAARRKGKWVGGMPLLGYDVDPRGGRLIVNEQEAARLREIFETYLTHQALLPTVQELDRRGWKNKQWTTRKGRVRGGRLFDKNSVFKLLTNITYLGKIKYKDEVHQGEHKAIVDEDLWQRVQDILRRNGRNGGKLVRNKYGALLKGLLHCVPCDCAMIHAYTAKAGKQYRYYVCTNAQKRGWHECPTKSVPAAEIERFVVQQIRRIGEDGSLVAETLRQARHQSQEGIEKLENERRLLQRELNRHEEEVRRLIQQACPGVDPASPATARLADLQDRIRAAEQRATEVREEIIELSRTLFDEKELTTALSLFDPVWDSLGPREQARVMQLLVERVGYDGANGTVSVTFRPSGIKALAQDAASNRIEEPTA